MKENTNKNTQPRRSQLLSDACKFVGLLFSIIKGIDILRKMVGHKNQLSYQDKLNARLKFEKDKAEAAEKHLRETLKIRQEFSIQKPAQPDTQMPFQPLSPKRFDPSAPMEDFKSIRLFGSAIHKGDKCAIIAPKGIGKTALMMQISTAIASGTPTGLWPTYDEGEHAPQRVLYYDGELTDLDMYNRYYKYGYEFPANFERYDNTQFRTADTLLADLEWKVENDLEEGSEATVVIDNVTKIIKTEQVSEVNKFNKRLSKIYDLARKRRILLTLISVFHVLMKEYTPGTSLGLKDAVGGSNLTNFDNAVVGIEQSKIGGKDILVKAINSRGEPEPDKVCMLHPIGMDEETHYHFKFLGEMSEEEALHGKLPGDDESKPGKTKEEQFLEEARAMKAYKDANHTQEQTADKFGCSRGTFINRMELLKKRGEM